MTRTARSSGLGPQRTPRIWNTKKVCESSGVRTGCFVSLPRLIRVGARRYTVRCNQSAIDSESVEAGAELHGVTNNTAMRIVLNPKNSEDRQRDTLLHEALHAMFNVAGIDQDLGSDTEERVVNRLAPILLDVLTRNPALTEYLTGGR